MIKNNEVKIWLFACGLCLGLGAYIGKTYYAKTETVEVEKEVIRKDVQTIIKEVVRPDGSKSTETIIVDKSKEKKDSTTKITVAQKADWAFSVLVSSDIGLKPTYGIQVDRRVLGPFSAVVGFNQRNEITLGIKYEF